MADDKVNTAENPSDLPDHTPERGYPVVEEVPAAGQDPDTLRRNEKHAVAAGIIDENDMNNDENNDDDKNDAKAEAAKKRAAASPRTAAPTGRSATPPTKASE